jgi:gentisate 1,2-dioxygenase
MLRYPWRRTRAALLRLAEHDPPGNAIAFDYVNPETGESCLPTLGFAAMMLRPGEPLRAPRRSSSSVFHVVEGEGHSLVNGERFDWTPADTFSAPVFARVEHHAHGLPAFVVRIHDEPLQRKLGFYEERAP